MLVTVVASLSMVATAAAAPLPPTFTSVAVNGSHLDAADGIFYTNDTTDTAAVTVTGDASATEIDYTDGLGGSQTQTPVSGVTTFAVGPFAAGENTLWADQVVGGVTSDQEFLDVQADTIPSVEGIGERETYTANDELGASVAIPGDDVELFVDGAKIADSTADSSGTAESFSLTSPLAAGYHTAVVKSVDGQEVESDASAPVHFYVAPASPAIQSPTSTQDQSAYVNRQPTITISGVDAGATANLYELDDQGDQGPSLASVTSTPGGTVALTPGTAVADGFHSYVVTQTETEGTGLNAQPITSDWTDQPAAETDVTVDTAAPELSSDVVDNPYTDENQPRFYVHVPGIGDDATAKVRLIDATTGLTLGEVGQYGSWVPSTPLADGAHSIYAVAVDDLGHVGTAHSATVTFTIDATAPSTPSFTSPTDGSTVTTGSPSITVHGEAGTDMCLGIDVSPEAQEADVACQTADGNGNATITPDTVLANGPHSLSVTSSDLAGNSSDARETITVAIATNAVGVAPVVHAPVQKPAPAVALTSVKLSSHTVSAGHPIKVRFLINTPGTITLALTKKVKTTVKVKVHGKLKTVTKTITKVVGTVQVKVTKAGPVSYTLTTTFAGHKLAHGNYTLSLKTTSGTSKSKPVTQALSVR